MVDFSIRKNVFNFIGFVRSFIFKVVRIVNIARIVRIIVVVVVVIGSQA